MDRFEFLMVLLSIIVGLGIAELLTNVVRQIRARNNTQGFWVHSGLVAILFLAFLQIWWESWDLREVEQWTFPALLLMLAGPAGLFVLSHLLYPQEIEDADLEAYYFENSRQWWSIAGLTVIFATGFRPLALGHSLFVVDNFSSFLLLGLFVILAISKLKRLHMAALPIIFLAMVLDIMVFKPTL